MIEVNEKNPKPEKSVEQDRMSLVHALQLLHKLRETLESLDMLEYAEAFNVVFEWIDNVVILLNKLGVRL